jgi:ParB/RepB/Spo0J family partition protein
MSKTELVREPVDVPLHQLEFWSEGNVRKTDVYVDIDELAQNIKENGLLHPLIVKKDTKTGRYLVFGGQRRLEACRGIKLDPVPCYVYKDVDMTNARLISLSENLYRKQMNPDDISAACEYLYGKYGDIDKVATKLGVSVPTVRKYLGYFSVPEALKELVRKKRITAQQALSIHTQFYELDKQIKIAKELSSIEDRSKKAKFYQAVKESSPRDDVPKIRARAERMSNMKEYKIMLPPRISEVYEKFAAESNVEVPELLASVLQEWAEQRRGHGGSAV